jgi:hypothetical protein
LACRYDDGAPKDASVLVHAGTAREPCVTAALRASIGSVEALVKLRVELGGGAASILALTRL